MKKEMIIKTAKKTLNDIKKAMIMMTAKNNDMLNNLMKTNIVFEKFDNENDRLGCAGFCYDEFDGLIHMNTEIYTEANTKKDIELVDAMIRTIIHEAGHIICSERDSLFNEHTENWYRKTNELTAAMKLFDKKYRFLTKATATIGFADKYDIITNNAIKASAEKRNIIAIY